MHPCIGPLEVETVHAASEVVEELPGTIERLLGFWTVMVCVAVAVSPRVKFGTCSFTVTPVMPTFSNWFGGLNWSRTLYFR